VALCVMKNSYLISENTIVDVISILQFPSLWANMFSLTNIRSRTMTCRVSDEHFEGYTWIATTEINRDNEKLLNHKQCQISHYYLLMLDKIIE
jgi:hypothetical protein